MYPARPAHADRLQCGPPTDWVQLANITRRALQNPDEAGGDEMRQISETMRDMNWTRLREWQQKIQRTTVDRKISQSIETLRNYSQTGVMQAPWILLDDLNRIEDSTQTICVELSGTSPLDLTRLGGKPSVAGFGLSPNGGTPQDYIRLGILPVVVAAFAVCLKLGVMLIQFAQTMRYKRRSCDVLAELRIGPYVFKGSLTILGIFGCRFVCADEDGRTLLTVVAHTGPAQLHVGDIQILAKVTATQNSFAAVRFDDQLPDETYAAVLKRSSTKPRLIRLPKLRHNVADQEDSQIDVPQDHAEEEEELTFERPNVRLDLG